MPREIPIHQVVGNALLTCCVIARTLAGLGWWWISQLWRDRKKGGQH